MAVRNSSRHLPIWSYEDWAFIANTDSDSEMEESNYRKNKLTGKKIRPNDTEYDTERKLFEERNGESIVGNKFGRKKHYFIDYYDMPEKPRNEEGFDVKLIEIRHHFEQCQNSKRIKREEEQEEEERNWKLNDAYRKNKIRRKRRRIEIDYNSDSSNDGSDRDDQTGTKKLRPIIVQRFDDDEDWDD